MFLEQQISILEWFLKDHVTLKSHDAENSALITGMNYILTYIEICNNISQLKKKKNLINAVLVSRSGIWPVAYLI